MSTPADPTASAAGPEPAPSPEANMAAAELDPVREARAHLELALAALDRLREVLPPPAGAARLTGPDGDSA